MTDVRRSKSILLEDQSVQQPTQQSEEARLSGLRDRVMKRETERVVVLMTMFIFQLLYGTALGLPLWLVVKLGSEVFYLVFGLGPLNWLTSLAVSYFLSLGSPFVIFLKRLYWG